MTFRPSLDAAAFHALIDAGLIAECLKALERAMPRSAGAVREAGDLLRLQRMCLARLGRFDEAARIGADVLALGDLTHDDCFRQAQILLQLGRGDAALPLAAAAVSGNPAALRYAATAVEAALTVDGGPARLLGALNQTLSAVASGRTGEYAPRASVLFPQHLSFGGGRLDHPSIRGLFDAASGVETDMPPADPGRLLCNLPALLRRAGDYADRLSVHPKVDRASAARFAASRIHAWIEPPSDWLLDFLSPYPVSLGQRPWVFCCDSLPQLFIPMLPHDGMTVTRETPEYWILKAHLESGRCLRILTHQPDSLGGLADFFDSRIIGDKTLHVNVWHRRFPPSSSRRRTCPRVWLFASSFFPSDAYFRRRGGIETLRAFFALADEFSDIELILRARLPSILPDGLTEKALNHPRVRYYPDPLDDEALNRLYAEADLFLMPCATVYRNSLAEALQAGLVPVVAETAGIHDFVRDDENGIVVSGLESVSRLSKNPPEFVHETALLWSNDLSSRTGFQAALERRLRDLLRDPAAFIRAADRNAAGTSGAIFTDADAVAFTAAMNEAAAQAEDMRRRPQPPPLSGLN